jgi:hypothetical protein
MRSLLALLSLAAPSVFAFAGAGSIPQGHVWPGYSGPGSHAFVPSGEAKFWNGVARTAGFVDAAGKTAATSAIISRVAGAGRYVWAACAANPVVCAGGAAFAAYMMQSNIAQDPQTGQWGKWKGNPGTVEYLDTGSGQWMSSMGAVCAAHTGRIQNDAYTRLVFFDYTSPSDGKDGQCRYQLFSFDVLQPDLAVTPVPTRPVLVPPEFKPVTQEELEEHFQRYEPSDDVANEAGAAGVPMPTAQPQMAPTRSPSGEPYKNAQGQTRQDVMDCVHNPQTMAPLAFECTMKSVDPATTSTTTHPDAGSSPAAPPGSASSPTGTPAPPEEKPSDLCALHPDIVACAKFGTQPQSDPMPRKSLPLAFATEALGLPAACPSPVALPNGQELSYQPVCDAVLSLRPLVVAFGALASMLMVVAALRAS